MKTQSFVITGMTCANCVMRVDKALNDSDKILEASVNLATEKAKVVMQDDCDVETVIETVRQAGYGAIVPKVFVLVDRSTGPNLLRIAVDVDIS